MTSFSIVANGVPYKIDNLLIMSTYRVKLLGQKKNLFDR